MSSRVPTRCSRRLEAPRSRWAVPWPCPTSCAWGMQTHVRVVYARAGRLVGVADPLVGDGGVLLDETTLGVWDGRLVANCRIQGFEGRGSGARYLAWGDGRTWEGGCLWELDDPGLQRAHGRRSVRASGSARRAGRWRDSPPGAPVGGASCLARPSLPSGMVSSATAISRPLGTRPWWSSSATAACGRLRFVAKRIQKTRCACPHNAPGFSVCSSDLR